MTEPTSYKLDGRPDVSVYLMAKDAEAVIEFAQAALDATVLMRMARPDGTLMHAEIGIGDSVIMLSQGSDQHPSFPVWLHVYVPDVDATYRRALAAGGESIQAPLQKDDPDRRCGVKDTTGNIWWFATSLAATGTPSAPRTS